LRGKLLYIEPGLKRRFTVTFFRLSLVFLVAVMIHGRTLAYVMPTEQLLHLMGSNFSRFKTLVITQSTQLKSLQGREIEVILNEKIWLKAPDLYSAELTSMPEDLTAGRGMIKGRGPGGDMSFRRLLLAGSLDARMSLLADMGIDIELVTITRFEGIIVYQLGGEDPESPKLLIEKETFLPIFFCYTLKNDPAQRRVSVRFGDYQKLGKGWYPFEIVYSGRQGVIEHCFVLDLQINTPIDRSLSEIILDGPPPYETMDVLQETPEDRRLREMIELLKDKYK
jgi:hypothetical protein